MKISDSTYEYLQRAFRRRRGFLLADAAWCCDGERHCVAFQVRLDNGRVAALDYRATSCATLLALAEHLVLIIPGMTRDEALTFTPETLLALHPGIPEGRRERACLAVRALRVALSSAG